MQHQISSLSSESYAASEFINIMPVTCSIRYHHFQVSHMQHQISSLSSELHASLDIITVK
ncbi:hypothetical protein DPMN_008112 [Dreissena polymorpha]|uniref:Uncharacterized protein n=1 Tax=Dreissena polymorpha TaxID=45954 RepID=A0A9D4MXR8_DREPO|nr:hypothetical protein DPMN_008112 [Dreissena polymorpha]